MNYCTHCGANVEENQRFCASCKEKQSSASAGSSIIEELGLLKNEAVSEDLFEKMESDVLVGGKQLAPEEVAAIEEQKRMEEEKQEREYAMLYIQKHNSMPDNYVLGFVGALLGGLVGAIPWAIVSSRGWFVAWLGYVIAIAASKGYDLMKVKLSMKKIWFVAIAVLVGVFAGQIMSDMIVIALEPELSGMFGDVFVYWTKNFGEYLSINAENLIVGLIFAALGTVSVLKGIRKETEFIEELQSKIIERENI